MSSTVQSLKKYRLVAFGLASLCYLLFYYRQGGVKDVGVINPGIRDVGVYVDAGKLILRGENPYVLIGNRFGFVGCVPFAIVSYLIPSNFETLFFQLLNLTGCLVFVFVFKKFFPRNNTGLVVVTLLFISSTREMLVTNQITGIIMGLLASAFYLSEIGIEKSSKKCTFFAAGLFVMALDLKPHLVIIFLGVYLISSKNRSLFFMTTFLWVGLHGLVDLMHQEILEFDWLKVLTDLQNQAQGGNLNDSVSFWPLINEISGFAHIPLFILTLPTILATIWLFYAAQKTPLPQIIIWPFIVPAFSIYFHHYDLIPVTVLILLAVEEKNIRYLLLPTMFFIIPIEYSNLQNQALVMTLLMLWKIESKFDISYSALFFSWVGFNLLHILNVYLEQLIGNLQSIIVTEIIVFSVAITLNQRFKAQTIKY
jgi:hypothetical protein